MIKKVINYTVIIAVLVALFFVSGAVYIVSETNQVVITQFGKPVGAPKTKAGLHLKLPFIQKAHYFEKRLLEWDGDPNQIPTRGKKYIWVDTTARWRISNALRFLQSVGTERGAHARLDDILNSATRDVITTHLLVETVRNSNRILDNQNASEIAAIAEEALDRIKVGREVVESEILERAAELAPQYGIELLDVRIKRINYVKDVRRKVYERMISERNRAAEKYRSEGKGKSAEIKGTMEKELKVIESEAYKTSQGIRGQADAKAVSIYADSYSLDPEFYSFNKTLETYKSTMDGKTTIILTTDGDYFKYLKNQK